MPKHDPIIPATHRTAKAHAEQLVLHKLRPMSEYDAALSAARALERIIKARRVAR